MSAGAPRRALIRQMTAPLLAEEPDLILVDVGADHGHIAAALGAVATERQPQRIGRRDIPWVVADGLLPFRKVDVAIIAGMGALTIAGILQRGPRPQRAAILHAPDDPPRLRTWLAANGWRIEAEGLAPEAGRFAEVLRVVPGEEPSAGLWLQLGPRLLQGDDPHLLAHLEGLRRYHAGLAAKTAQADPVAHARFQAIADFLTERIASRRPDGP